MGTWYCTREDVKSALDSSETARNNVQVDQAIEAASRKAETLTRRKFYPEVGTKYFDWPNSQMGRSYRLWLDESEVISVSSFTSAGTSISSGDYFLEPSNDGPPYSHIDLDLSSSASFGGGSTDQRSIAVTGVFGYKDETASVGTLDGAIASTSTTTVNTSATTQIGVGSVVKVDSERMIVRARNYRDTTQNLQTPLAADNSDVLVAVTTGSEFQVGEEILLDAETMLIVAIAGNNLIVKRAWDGSPLDDHTGSDIYALRELVVERGALGTTAATHLDDAPILLQLPPATIRTFCIAEAMNTLQQQGSGYARTVGSGENQREATGRALKLLYEDVCTEFRRYRSAAV